MLIHHVISFYPDKERGKPDARLRCRDSPILIWLNL